MDFHGAAVPLQPSDFAEALKLMPGVEEAALWAVIDVETGGSGFKAGRPDALFERHIFYRELAGNTVKQSLAVNLGLAYPKWHTRPYPTSSAGVYAEIDAACAIDEDAALRSTSWGLGQIMGSECKEAGYRDAKDMVVDFMAGEFQQLAAMVRLVKARGLDKALINHDWATYAKAYNGAGYKQNQYDTKLAAAYARRRDGYVPRDYRGLQANLKALGLYSGEIDGIAGPVTQSAVIQFQRSRGLPDNGTIDAALIEAVGKSVAARRPPMPGASPPAAAPPAPPPAPHPLPAKHVATGGGAGAAVGGVFAAVDPANAAVWLLGGILAGVLLGIVIHHFQNRKG